MDRVAVFDGKEPNNTVNVSATGALQTESTVVPAATDVETTRGLLGTSSDTLAGEDALRAQVVLQNLSDAETIHVRLDDSAATLDDLQIGPGASFSFPPGMAYQGEIRGIATDVDTKYVLIVYRRS